ncbi:chemerin-like receptor 2 [Eleutherodactylus coqui]|uniref:chemerin-like receptor 2 n=1 Tax=Eleutherodactylus coqui TaxID=57060 RepID=UPI003462F2BF
MAFHELCYSIVDIHALLEYYESYSSIFRYFSFVMSIVTCLLGLGENAYVIFITGFVMKKHKSKYWFLNLAIADFGSLLTLPLHAAAIFKGTWPFGPHMCKVFLFSVCANMHASVFILLSLNIAIVFSVAQPMFHLKFITRRVSFWICCFIWFFALLCSLPVYFFSGEFKIGDVIQCSFISSDNISPVAAINGYNMSIENATGNIVDSTINTKFNPFIEKCSSNSCCGGEEARKYWNSFMFTSKNFAIPFLIIGYFIPLVIIIICNLTIIAHVKKSKTINMHRLYRIALMVILVYFISWTPIVIADTMLFIAILHMNLIEMFKIFTFTPLMFSIAYVSSCLNPIVYVLSSGRMRMGLNDFISSIKSPQN